MEETEMSAKDLFADLDSHGTGELTASELVEGLSKVFEPVEEVDAPTAQRIGECW
jgi:hypothetical protein